MPRIAIEEKHIYNTYDTYVVGNIDASNVVNTTRNFVSIEPIYPVQGTDENNRIGRKIQTQFLSEEGIIQMNTFTQENGLFDYFNGYLQDQMQDLQPSNYEFPVDFMNIVIPLRHFIVTFEDEEFYNGTIQEKGIYLNEWYKQLVIQTFNDPNANPSILTDTKRESTSFTGRFSILKDDIYYLDFKGKREIHFKYRLPLKKTVNFDAPGADPTNLHIFSIWIGPINPFTDYFNRAFGTFLVETDEIINPPTIAFINSTMKLTYIDI